MAKANSTSPRTPQGTSDERPVSYERFQMFDTDEMREHGRTLHVAGQTLNLAFDCILAIGTMAGLVRGNGIEGSNIYGMLNDHACDSLLCGIEVLSDHLNEALVDTAQNIHEALKGGEQ